MIRLAADRMRRALGYLTCLLPLAGAGGCTGLFQSTARPEQVYFLRPNTAVAGPTEGADAPARPALTESIHVARPMPAPGLDSSHIVLLESDRRMSYYMASRWPAPLPDVIEELAIQTLTASGSWSAVQGSNSNFPSDYLLQIRIRDFEADYGLSPAAGSDSVAPQVHIVLDCTVGRRSGRDIVASFTVEGSAKATANRLAQVVAAFEEAAAAALSSMSSRTSEAVAHASQKVDRPVSSMNR